MTVVNSTRPTAMLTLPAWHEEVSNLTATRSRSHKKKNPDSTGVEDRVSGVRQLGGAVSLWRHRDASCVILWRWGSTFLRDTLGGSTWQCVSLWRDASPKQTDRVNNGDGDDEWKLVPAVTGALSSQPHSDDCRLRERASRASWCCSILYRKTVSLFVLAFARLSLCAFVCMSACQFCTSTVRTYIGNAVKSADVDVQKRAPSVSFWSGSRHIWVTGHMTPFQAALFSVTWMRRRLAVYPLGRRG